MGIEICELRRKDEKLWDEFVFSSANSTFYHQIRWKYVIENVYKHRSYYMIAKEDGEIRGILPLFFIRNKAVSIPFAPYGGVCADDETVKKKLIEEAISVVRERGMRYLELRNQEEESNSDFRTDYTYVTFIIPLHSDLDILWRKTAKGARRAVKKALRENVKISMGHEYLDDFYTIYAERNKELGTPVHSYLFFKHILSVFQDQANIQVAEKEGKIIGAKFLLFFKDRIISGWAASDRRYRAISPNSLLTWEILRYGCEKGYAFFDFGRSEKDSGTFRFKRAWGGAIIKQLYYQFYMHKTRNLPVLSRKSLKRRIFSNFWRKLPLPMTKVIGPHIRKNLP